VRLPPLKHARTERKSTMRPQGRTPLAGSVTCRVGGGEMSHQSVRRESREL
jgi:hypothetical protein